MPIHTARPGGGVDGIRCDVCGCERLCGPQQTYEQLQTALRHAGWLIQPTADACPQCRPINRLKHD